VNTGAKRKLVVDLRSRSRAFCIPEYAAKQLAAAAPPGWAVSLVHADTDSSGDGSKLPSEESVREIADAEIYLGYGLPRPLWNAAKKLRWVHSASAGVKSVLFPEMIASDVALTNSAGIYGDPIAEHIVAGVMFFLRGFDIAGTLQRRGEWDSALFGTAGAPIREVGECRVLIVGAGGIGSETARRFSSLGATVTGVRRSPEKGIPAGFARVVGLDAIDAELPSADVLVLAAPLTADTHMLMTAERLAKLPEGAIVANVGRGALIDEPALISALRTGQLRGAVLDVFQQEPLASDSPLWHLPQVLLTPHMAGVSPRLFWTRLSALFLENWARYCENKPLRNLVDKHAGY
jgi:phosphoglycerate dehydrogenase-like enzyme